MIQAIKEWLSRHITFGRFDTPPDAWEQTGYFPFPVYDYDAFLPRKKPLTDLFSGPNHEANVTTRAIRCLTQAGITSVWELENKTEVEIAAVKGIGVTTAGYILHCLQKRRDAHAQIIHH